MGDYYNLLCDKGKGCLEDLAMLVIAHPENVRHGLPEENEATIDELEAIEECRHCHARLCLRHLMLRPQIQAEGWRSEVEKQSRTTLLLTFQRDREPRRPFSYQSYDKFSDYDPVGEASDSDKDQ